MNLWILSHPAATGGWVYLTEEKARENLNEVKDKILKNPNVPFDEFKIESYKIQDKELYNIIKEALPEFFL